MNPIKLWAGFGSFTCIAISASPALQAAPTDTLQGTASNFVVAQGGEGGESDSVPSTYRLLSSDPQIFAFDVRAQVGNYVQLVETSYRDVAAAATRMQAAITQFLKTPSPETLAVARATWVSARQYYLVTEVFRFYDGPIDLTASGATGPEPHLNAWPLNEAFIDSVKGQPKAGIISNADIPLTRESIMARDQVNDESDVTTGWHAIEFLLWGQDFDPDGPGDRPASDYLAGEPTRDRRRLYLATVTEMLVSELRSLEAAWAPDKDNYRRRFLAMEPREALGRAINGVANLVGHELATERLSVALDSGDQEDEHSCFSDTTHQDHLYDLHGARNVWLGSTGDDMAPDSLRALMLKVDPALAARTDASFRKAIAAVASMDQPFDAILRAPEGSPPRLRAEAAISSFQELAGQLAAVGRRVGVLVIVPGLAQSPTG